MNKPIENKQPDNITPLKDKAIYVWLDILGYSAETEKGDIKKIEAMLDKLNEYFKESEDFILHQISDGLLLTIHKSKYEDQIKIFNKIGKLQMRYLKDTDRSLRGGIVVGSKDSGKENENNFIQEFTDNFLQTSKRPESLIIEIKKLIFKYGKQVLIGNGLSRAHNMESNKIDWPIIGTDEEMMGKLKKEFGNFDDNFGLAASINMKGEKVYFIDFLELDKDYYKFLVAQASESKGDAKTQAKYIWLLRYFRQKFQITDLIPELVGLYL